jgi:hypothetical protein
MENTIWSLKDSFGRNFTSFEDLAWLGSQHFKKLFIVEGRVTIDVIVQMALLFPRFVEEEYNMTLMEEVSEEELKEVLHSFQKDKSPGPDGWTMDFFVGLYDLIGNGYSKGFRRISKKQLYSSSTKCNLH